MIRKELYFPSKKGILRPNSPVFVGLVSHLEVSMWNRWVSKSLCIGALAFASVLSAIAPVCAQTAQEDPKDSAKKNSAKKDSPPAPTPKAGDTDTTYRIGVEDELQITVWREQELSSLAVVRPDGKITLPLINDVAVIGLTPEELQTLVAQKLKPFVNEPQVTVTVRTIRSRKVFLVGQTLRQGSFPLNGSKTVLELIAEAGGLNAFAKSASIYVLRTIDGKKTKIPFHYKKALSGESENVLLMPGDVVFVP
jgi:polysaccharide export outer membrane protein